MLAVAFERLVEFLGFEDGKGKVGSIDQDGIGLFRAPPSHGLASHLKHSLAIAWNGLK